MEAVQLAPSSQKSQSQIAKDVGIADSPLHHWRQQVAQQGEQAFPGSGHQSPQEEELRQLKRDNELLRQERELLKKAIGLFWRSQL